MEAVLPRIRLRRKVRKPKGPLWRTAWLMIALSAVFIFWLTRDAMQGRPEAFFFMATQAGWIGMWWPVARTGHPPIDERWRMFGWATFLAGVFVAFTT